MKTMKNKPLSTPRIAYSNLNGKPGRTAALVIIVAIMAFAIFGGAVLSGSLENGLTSLDARLGADIALVPPGSEQHYENIILMGEPVHFYFDTSLDHELHNIAGVGQVTTQFHLSTFETTPCCEIGVHLIGVDFETDFVVTAWLAEAFDRQMADGEVIIGRNVIVESGDSITFFGHTLNVVARIERTGTGMDNTIFITMDTARTLAASAQLYGHISQTMDVQNAVSAILISVIPGYEILDVASRIRDDFPGVGIVMSRGIYYTVSSSLRLVTRIISIITGVLVLLVVLVLAILFSLIINSRKKEFSILRIIGATRKKLISIVLAEALMISLSGAVLGCILAAIIVFPFGGQIGAQMGMPLLLPGILAVAGLMAMTIAISVGVGSLASAYSAYKISRAETYATMREGE